MTTPDIARYFQKEDATFTIPAIDILAQHGDMRYALLYSTIFFPKFIEVEGSILLDDNIPDTAEQFIAGKKTSKMTLAALDASFNFVEIGYIFRPGHYFDTSTLEIKLAHIIREAWNDKLKRLYPSRIFSVSVLEPSVSGSVYSLEFFEVR